MLRFFRFLLGLAGGLFDGVYRAVMLHYGRDLAAEAAQAHEAEAARADREVEAEREQERHAEQLDATLLLLEAVRAGLPPAAVLPEVARIVDPEAAWVERAQARKARAEAIRALPPPRPVRQPREEVVVRSGWPTIVDPEDGAAASVGYYPA